MITIVLFLSRTAWLHHASAMQLHPNGTLRSMLKLTSIRGWNARNDIHMTRYYYLDLFWIYIYIFIFKYNREIFLFYKKKYKLNKHETFHFFEKSRIQLLVSKLILLLFKIYFPFFKFYLFIIPIVSFFKTYCKFPICIRYRGANRRAICFDVALFVEYEILNISNETLQLCIINRPEINTERPRNKYVYNI